MHRPGPTSSINSAATSWPSPTTPHSSASTPSACHWAGRWPCGWASTHPTRAVAGACQHRRPAGHRRPWQTRIQAVTADGMRSIRDAVLDRWFAAGFAARHPDWFAQAQATFDATDPVGYAGCCAALRDSDLRTEVAAIVAPTLVIGGEFDQATPPAEAQWLARSHRPERVDRLRRCRASVEPGPSPRLQRTAHTVLVGVTALFRPRCERPCRRRAAAWPTARPRSARCPRRCWRSRTAG